MKLSIRAKLLISFSFILLLSAAVILVINSLTDQFIRAQQIGILNDKAQTVANSLQDFFLDTEQSHLSIANDYRRDGETGSKNFIPSILYLLRTHSAVKQVVILSTSGRELYKFDHHGRVSDDKLSLEIPTAAFNTAKGNDTGISKVYTPEGQTDPRVDIFSPIVDAHNGVVAIVKSQVQLDTLQQIFSRLELGRNGVAYIVDDEGQIISHPRSAQLQAQGQVSSRAVIEKLLRFTYKDITSQDHYYTNEVHTPVIASSNKIASLGWIAVVEQPESDVFQQLSYMRTIIVAALIGTLALLIVLALVLSNLLAHPITQLTLLTRRIEEGDYTGTANIKTGDELESLATSFGAMARQLASREHSLQDSLEESLKLAQSLAVERDRQETLLQSLTDGVFAVDNDGKIVLFNKAAETITGLNSHKIMGQVVDEVICLYHGDTPWPLAHYSSQSKPLKQKLKHEGIILEVEKRRLILSLSIAPVVLADQKTSGWVASFHDMTSERELEAMKLDFVSMAAHELRTPLTALRGYLSLLLEEVSKKLSKDELVFLNRSLISSNQLSSLIENLLNVSRIERGALKLEIQPTSVEKMIEGSMMNLQEVALQKSISLSYDPPKKMMPLVLADQFRAGEVLTNLVANGLNYTKSGGSVKVSLMEHNGFVIVAVKDTGEGISASAQEHLFTKFYRVQSSLAMGSKGTGLGLYISKAIIDAHKGKIWVESVANKGSTFFFSLPIAPKGSLAPVLGRVNKNATIPLTSTKKG